MFVKWLLRGYKNHIFYSLKLQDTSKIYTKYDGFDSKTCQWCQKVRSNKYQKLIKVLKWEFREFFAGVKTSLFNYSNCLNSLNRLKY